MNVRGTRTRAAPNERALIGRTGATEGQPLRRYRGSSCFARCMKPERGEGALCKRHRPGIAVSWSGDSPSWVRCERCVASVVPLLLVLSPNFFSSSFFHPRFIPQTHPGQLPSPPSIPWEYPPTVELTPSRRFYLPQIWSPRYGCSTEPDTVAPHTDSTPSRLVSTVSAALAAL